MADRAQFPTFPKTAIREDTIREACSHRCSPEPELRHSAEMHYCQPPFAASHEATLSSTGTCAKALHAAANNRAGRLTPRSAALPRAADEIKKLWILTPSPPTLRCSAAAPQRQARACAVVRRTQRVVCDGAGRWKGVTAQGCVRGTGQVRDGMCGRWTLEGAQAGAHGGALSRAQ
jgi:hypothetical protein